MIDFDTVKIQWIGDPVDEAGLREDMAQNLAGIDEPNELFIHSYFTNADLEGPYVFVYGEGDCFLAQYFEETEWISQEGWKNEEGV